MIDDPIRKNILDLNFQKYNSLLNTVIMIIVTLFGILAATFTAIALSGKFDLLKTTTIIVFISINVGLTGFLTIYYLQEKLESIKAELRKMRGEVK